jgi:hypothetical protein
MRVPVNAMTLGDEDGGDWGTVGNHLDWLDIFDVAVAELTMAAAAVV